MPALRVISRFGLRNPCRTVSFRRVGRPQPPVRDTQGNFVKQNPTPIQCQECFTRLGALYSCYIPKHKSGREIFIERRCADDSCRGPYGPAIRQ